MEKEKEIEAFLKYYFEKDNILDIRIKQTLRYSQEWDVYGDSILCIVNTIVAGGVRNRRIRVIGDEFIVYDDSYDHINNKWTWWKRKRKLKSL